MNMPLKKSSSDIIDDGDYVYVLPGNSSDTLQPEDSFVWVEQNDQNSDHNTIISSDGLSSSQGGASGKTHKSSVKPGASVHDTLMSDFIEDASYNYHEDQYDSTVEKISYKKKNTKQNPSHTRLTTSRTDKSPEESFNINIFDRATVEILRSIVSTSNYYSGNFGNIISKGQKSVVAHTYISKKTYPTWEPKGKPILMYAFINNEYNKRYRNWRWEDNVVKVYKLCCDKMKNKKIFQKVQNEKEHLCILNKAKCNVPEVRRSSRNIIMMSLVGKDGVTAPSIDTLATHPVERGEAIYHIIVKDIDSWYKTLHLIHGALSTKNVLFWDKEIYYIEWSHSVKAGHPLALKKLIKDCSFVTKFFESRGVPVKPTEKLFKDITGLNEIDESVLSIISRKKSKDLWKSQHLTNPNRRPSIYLHS